MPLLESILLKIAEKVLSFVITNTGLDKKIREKFRQDPVKRAFAKAFGRAYTSFEKSNPTSEANLFDSSFFENEGAEIIAQLLTPGGKPDPTELAARWVKSLNIRQSEKQTTYVRDMEPMAIDFIEKLETELAKEPILQGLTDSRALQQIADDLSAMRTKIDANQATPGTLRDYLHWLIERNLYLDARGTMQTERQVQVKLDQIYISLRAQREYAPGEVDRRLFEKDLKDIESKTSTTLLAEEIEGLHDEFYSRLEIEPATQRESTGEVLELSAVVEKYDRLVILGDPGSGKSTLLRFLALSHAQALWHGRTNASGNLGVPRFPILIRIADYVEGETWKEKTLTEFLSDACGRHECPKAGLANLMNIQLVRGNCLIMLDGLDEIVNPDDRRNVVARILDFVRRHGEKDNRFVITSRVAGYRTAPLGEPFAHFTVQEMNESQIQQFLQRWCPAVEASQTPDLSVTSREATAQREIDEILKAVHTNPGVRRLAANPLLLRILALIHRTGAQLPQKRIELYKLAADTLARTWRTAQGVPEVALALVRDEYLNPLLGKLAYWMHLNKPTGVATEKEVIEQLSAEWARIKGLQWNPEDPNPDVMIQVEGFLKSVREHTGLFVERAPKRYGFMHLTFEEYYAARHLIARSRTRAQLIRERLHDSRWDEPILLALGFVGLESPEEAAELVDTAILAVGEDARDYKFTPSDYEKVLGRDYLFALLCMADNIPVYPERSKELVQRLISELRNRNDSARYGSYSELLGTRLETLGSSKYALDIVGQLMVLSLRDSAFLWSSTAPNLESVAETNPVVANKLSELLDDSNAGVRSNAALSLRSVAETNPVVANKLLELLDDSNAGVRSNAALSLRLVAETYPAVANKLLELLDDEDNDVRSNAALSLRSVAETYPAVANKLLELLDDEDADVRTRAAFSLRSVAKANPAVANKLLELLDDEDADVRSGVVSVLGVVAEINLVVANKLLELLNDSIVWTGAASSLMSIAAINPVVVNKLLELLDDEDAHVRTRAAFSLRSVAAINPAVANKLLELLDDSNAGVRSGAVSVLTSVIELNAGLVTKMAELLDDEDADVKSSAALSLRSVAETNPVVANKLLELLDDSNAGVRSTAAFSLMPIVETNSVVANKLAELLDDEDNEVRVRAAFSLEPVIETNSVVANKLAELLVDEDIVLRTLSVIRRSCWDSVTDTLLDSLLSSLEENENWQERTKIATFFGTYGPKDATIIKALMQGLTDPDNDVREACALSLAKLGRRFVDIRPLIAQALINALDDPKYDEPDTIMERSGHDYAFDGLWSLASGSKLP